jgi:hypothetical protein
VLHTAQRKLFKSGRSVVVGVPDYVVRKLEATPGDTFYCVFDDETNTLTYVRALRRDSGPRLTVNGVVVESTLMP